MAEATDVRDLVSQLLEHHGYWVQEDLDLQSYFSVDLDFGTLFYTGFRSSRLGMSLRNLGGDKDVIGQIARFPMVFNLSGAAEIYGNLGDPMSITVAVEQMSAVCECGFLLFDSRSSR